MGYTCKNYRAAGTTYSGYSQGMVLADLYRENGNVYRTAAPVADCGSYLAAISYANRKNNELKVATEMASEIVAAVLSTVTCPTAETHPDGEPATIIGCGRVIEDAEVDGEGLIDCPHCGMWFHFNEAGRHKVADSAEAKREEQLSSTPTTDSAELRKAAKYALTVFEGHCNSNVHSLGCDCALAWLRLTLGEPLTDRDKRDLRSINVHVPD